MKSYRDYPSIYIKAKETNTLNFIGDSLDKGNNGQMASIEFPSKGKYQVHTIDADGQVDSRYKLIGTFPCSVDIYNGNLRVARFKADEIYVYYNSGYSCIVQLINKDRALEILKRKK